MYPKILKVLLVISILLFLGSTVLFIINFLDLGRQEEQFIEEVVEQPEPPAIEEPEPEPEPELEPEPEPEPEPERPDIPIDFEGLWLVNPHIHAWITIPGTVVNYPVLQSPDYEDQEFYLYHTWERVPSALGAIFTQNFNSKDFRDRNTIVYGHNMADESMFGSLRNYFNDDYRMAHSHFVIYTPYNIFTYYIFAIVVYSDAHVMYFYDFEEEGALEEYLEELRNRPVVVYWSSEREVTDSDKIVTLATCTVYENERLFVVGVLIDEQ